MDQVNVQDAKTHLSRLLARVEAGESIVLARSGRPVARLEPIDDPGARSLGFLDVTTTEAFFEPLPSEELAAWEQR